MQHTSKSELVQRSIQEGKMKHNIQKNERCYLAVVVLVHRPQPVHGHLHSSYSVCCNKQ